MKLPLDAAVGIPEVWLADPEGERILRYRSAGPDGYAKVETASRGESVSPAKLPGAVMDVGEVLG